MTFQGVGAGIAGVVAQVVPVRDAIGVMAVLSLLVSAALTPGLRAAARATRRQASLV
jgi:hypothetical protein